MCVTGRVMANEPIKPVIEKIPEAVAEPDVTTRSLRQRIRQQEILSELGVLALQGATFIELLDQTARLTAEGLGTEFCKVLEYQPHDNRLLVRAGVGWGKGVVGAATVGADMASPAGYALHTGKPVISNHLENEERFRTPELLADHGIYRAMNVILQGDGKPFGVLEVDSRDEGEFAERDIAFLQGAANILGMAIEQQRYHRKLTDALDRYEILLKEVNHRVKNSLQVVSSMLNLQAKAAGDPVLSARLAEASLRITTVGRAYDRLAYKADYETMELNAYLREVAKDIMAAVAPCELLLEAAGEIQFSADRAILVALVINELASNASKYAYGDKSGGKIWVKVVPSTERSVLISVRDEGIGLPAGFDASQSRGLGTRLIMALAKQLDATYEPATAGIGTNVTLRVPLEQVANR